jgi:hypothetical protein
LEAAAEAYVEALRAFDSAEEACIEAARTYLAAGDAEEKSSLSTSASPAHIALRAHALATIRRERVGYEEAVAGFLRTSGLRPDAHALRSIDVRYLRVFAPADVGFVIREVRKGNRNPWKQSIEKVNEVLQSRMSLGHHQGSATTGRVGDYKDSDVQMSASVQPLPSASMKKRPRSGTKSEDATTNSMRLSRQIASKRRPALVIKTDDHNSSYDSSSEEESPAVAVNKPKDKIITTIVPPKPSGYKHATAAGLKVEASWKPLRGLDAAVVALLDGAQNGALIRLVEATRDGDGPLCVKGFRHGWKLQFGLEAQHTYESEPVGTLGAGVVVCHVPLMAPPKAVEALFGRSGTRLAKDEYHTYEVLVYDLEEGEQLIKFHEDYYKNELKELLEISGCYFEMDSEGRAVDTQNLHSALHLMTGDGQALAISCSSYTMSGPGVCSWRHARIREKHGFQGVAVAVVRRRWKGLSVMDENVLQQWTSLYRSQAEENAAQFKSTLNLVPKSASPQQKFVRVFTSLEFKAAAFPGKYACFDNDDWVVPTFPAWFADFGGWQRVGNGGPGTVIYSVANMHHARSLAHMLHWHEQPREAFHHRDGGLRSGLVELGKNGTILEGIKLKTRLRIFNGENAIRLEKCERVAISTLSNGCLRFEGFFKLVELGEETAEGGYQESVFEKLK